MKVNSINVINTVLLVAGLWITGRPAVGQIVQFTNLDSFNFTNGSAPFAAMTLGPDGNLYGTTAAGGSNRVGTVFRLTTNGTLTPLVSFSNTNGLSLGAYPAGVLTLGRDGAFYGTTFLGGSNDSGTVFRVTTNGVLNSLYSFDPLPRMGSITKILDDSAATNANGGQPFGALTLGKDGNFYGTTIYGGSNGVGTVFQVTTNGSFTSLFSFDPSATNGSSTNVTGSKPTGLMMAPDGSFYGGAAVGGTAGQGTLFRITTNGEFSTLFSFDPGASDGTTFTNNNGAEPYGALTLGVDGNLYGTALYGGIHGSGTLFRMTTDGTFTRLFSFNSGVLSGNVYTNDTGAQPVGPLVPGSGGQFVGAASNGGSGGQGTLFQLTINGDFSLLFAFDALISKTNATGGEPFALTMASDGNFYGATFQGGLEGYGTVFELALANLNIQLLAGKAVLIWNNSASSLQSAPAVTGTYTNIPNATSPYTNTTSAGQQFFRLVGN
jgi:uncharacterized repeat protein (TIGR03803 family)